MTSLTLPVVLSRNPRNRIRSVVLLTPQMGPVAVLKERRRGQPGGHLGRLCMCEARPRGGAHSTATRSPPTLTAQSPSPSDPTEPDQNSGNWIQTVPGKKWFTILRLYGPLEPWFDKTWVPGEIEPLDAE